MMEAELVDTSRDAVLKNDQTEDEMHHKLQHLEVAMDNCEGVTCPGGRGEPGLDLRDPVAEILTEDNEEVDEAACCRVHAGLKAQGGRRGDVPPSSYLSFARSNRHQRSAHTTSLQPHETSAFGHSRDLHPLRYTKVDASDTLLHANAFVPPTSATPTFSHMASAPSLDFDPLPIASAPTPRTGPRGGAHYRQLTDEVPQKLYNSDSTRNFREQSLENTRPQKASTYHALQDKAETRQAHEYNANEDAQQRGIAAAGARRRLKAIQSARLKFVTKRHDAPDEYQKNLHGCPSTCVQAKRLNSYGDGRDDLLELQDLRQRYLLRAPRG